MQVKFIQSLYSSARHLKAAEYLLDVTLKLMDDNRILGKCLMEIQKSVIEIINATLYLNSSEKTMPSGKEEKAKLFFKRGGKKLLDKAEIEELKKILIFAKRHKETHLEFVRGEKLVLFGSKECKILTKKGLKDSINTLKHIILKLDKKTEGINTPFLLEMFKRL